MNAPVPAWHAEHADLLADTRSLAIACAAARAADPAGPDSVLAEARRVGDWVAAAPDPADALARFRAVRHQSCNEAQARPEARTTSVQSFLERAQRLHAYLSDGGLP